MELQQPAGLITYTPTITKPVASGVSGESGPANICSGNARIAAYVEIAGSS